MLDVVATHPILALFLGAPALVYTALYLYKKTMTLRAISPAPFMVRLVSSFVTTRKLSEAEFYAADGAPPAVQAQRREALDRLSQSFDSKVGPRAAECNEHLKGLSDIRFQDTNRVPPPFQPVVRERLRLGFIVERSEGPYLIDVDGNRSLDVSGSYGVNVVGYDFYKRTLQQGLASVQELGPNVLGPLHPIIFPVLARLREVSGLDECSFHMSGTEAIMCAVRLCRFNTRRRLIVQFAGKYHGWWDGVQPGPGNERMVHDTLTLKDVSPASLALLRARAGEIAAVLVDPGLPPSSDAVLLDAKTRTAVEGRREAYRVWLTSLRQVCTACEVPLVFDEVYTGFRLAPRGAIEFYGVQPDMVVYGKTLGGGVACGVVCGKKSLMARFDPEHPLRVSYVIGTFAASPLTLGPMRAFLDWVTSAEAATKYQAAASVTTEWVVETNRQLAEQGFPVRVDHLATIWTCVFTKPGRFHWLFQYYLRDEGLALSWVGTGRCLFSLDFATPEYAKVQVALINAAQRMADDGWWWDASPKRIQWLIVKEMAGATLTPSFLRSSAASVAKAK